MEERIIISGMGGQGVISLGILIGISSMFEDKFVSIVPSYGAEMRGGISNCFVTISDQQIGSPVFSRADTGILFYQLAIDKHVKTIKNKGVLIYNENMTFQKINRNDIQLISTPANYMAEKIGNSKIANIILAGVWCNLGKIIQYNTMIKAIEETFKNKSKELIDLNKKAFDSGYNFV